MSRDAADLCGRSTDCLPSKATTWDITVDDVVVRPLSHDVLHAHAEGLVSKVAGRGAANGARCRHDRPDRDRRPLVHDSVKERFRGGRPVDSRKSATTGHSRYPTFCRSPRASSSSGYRPGNTPKPHSMGQAGRPCSRTCAARPGARLRGAVAACSRRAGGGDAGGAVGRAGG